MPNMEMQPVTEKLISEWLKTRDPFRHKGDYGRASLIAGSKGMMGAALLSALAVIPCAISCAYHSISGTLLAGIFTWRDEHQKSDSES